MKKILFTLFLVTSLLCSVSAEAKGVQKKSYNIVFVGNSITQGVLHADRTKTAPPVFAAEMIGKALSGDVNFRNVGRAGATTFDWLPEANRYFPLIEKSVAELKAENPDAQFIFPIMLGTNDSASKGPTGCPVSNEDYKKNLLTMIAKIREMCPGAIFVLQQPIWYSPNTYNGAVYLLDGLKRMMGYTPTLVEIANENGDIYMGDTESFEFFHKNYEKCLIAEPGYAGTFYLHPHEAGAKKLAKFWTSAIVKAVKASGK